MCKHSKFYLLLLQFSFFSISFASQVSEPTISAQNSIHEENSKRVACNICLETKDLKNFIALSCCRSLYCRDCLMHLVAQALNERTTAQLKCPNLSCRHEISQADLAQIVSDEGDLKLLGSIQLQEKLAQQPGTKHCPTSDCPHVFISEGRDQQLVKCPMCTHEYCSVCLVHHSTKVSCKEAAAKLSLEEKNSEEWILKNTRSCPGCHIRIQKDGGCEKMQCRLCSYNFLWENLDNPQMTKLLQLSIPKRLIRQQQLEAALKKDKGERQQLSRSQQREESYRRRDQLLQQALDVRQQKHPMSNSRAQRRLAIQEGQRAQLQIQLAEAQKRAQTPQAQAISAKQQQNRLISAQWNVHQMAILAPEQKAQLEAKKLRNGRPNIHRG
jgi:hypothetical protein